MKLAFARPAAVATVLAGFLLSACDKPAATAAASPVAVGVSNSASSQGQALGGERFELVLVSRPERVTDYLDIFKRAYDVCVLEAKLSQFPTQPFMTLPDGFVTEKTTLVVDGRSRYRKIEQYSPNLNALSPKSGCNLGLGTTSTTTVVSRELSQHIEVDVDGKVFAEAPEALTKGPLAKPPVASSSFTVEKSQGGVPMRCLPPGAPAISGGLAIESCIYAGSDASLSDAEGQPELIYLRFKQPVNYPGVEDIRVTQLLSLSVGKPVRVGLFNFVSTQP